MVVIEVVLHPVNSEEDVQAFVRDALRHRRIETKFYILAIEDIRVKETEA